MHFITLQMITVNELLILILILVLLSLLGPENINQKESLFL